ncbi:hypothetical protein [Streptomyces sp. NPDC046332]|uniref:hypothetical protein n=1 Tax=unclassified Streptomyces TaxID=2593676 RepID=UPI0033F74CD6
MATLITNNRQLIDAPNVGLQRRYGLFDAVSARLPMDSRLIGSGLQFLVDHCGPAQLYDQTCVVSPTKTYMEGSDLREADPFWVVARKRCGTVGRTADDMLRAVRSQLDSQDQTWVESVLWDGAGLASIPADQTLTGAGATVVTPAAPGAGAAISALENAFYGAAGYRGVIHVNMQAEGALQYAGMLQPSAGVLRTPIGTAVSLGAGYDITGPVDPGDPETPVPPAAGFVWAFITSPVTEWSADIPQPDPRQTLDRTLNQWDVVAERVHAVAWECPVMFAVQVPLAAPAVATTPAVP